MLPANFPDYDAYVEASLRYMRDYKWVYNFAVTNLLVEDVLSRIPGDWLSALTELSNEELNLLPFGFMKDNWPESLVEFCNRSRALHLVLTDGPPGVDPSQLPRELSVGLTQKKQHEVCRLVSLVRQECQANGIRRVLDIGAGLGYLGRLLHHQYGVKVLGIEADGQKMNTASRHQLASCPSSASIRYVSGMVTPKSQQFIRQSIHMAMGCMVPDCSCGERWAEATGALSVCTVGLHVCGDLATSTLKLFAKVPELRSLVLVPCCHHKMSLEGDCAFPLSRCLRTAMKETMLTGRIYLLRLASQETAMRWRYSSEDDHRKHSFHVLSRAVLQLHAHQAKLNLVKKRRRAVRRSTLNSLNFTDFLDDVLMRFNYEGPGGDDKVALRSQLEQLWSKHKEKCQIVELLTALQVMMQAPAEHLVMVDRLAYLQEADHMADTAEARVIKVMDDDVSPRCLVLVANKPPHP